MTLAARIVALLLFLLPALSIGSTAALPADDFDGVIRLGGSTTLLPVVADCANTFMEKFATWDKVDPAFPRKSVQIIVTGGGSGFGIQGTSRGVVNIGLLTRTLKEVEKLEIGVHQTFPVGRDGLAIVTSKDSPLAVREGLSRAEAAKIVSGAAKTWKDFDPALPAVPIVVFVRDMAASANEMVQTEVLRDLTFSPGALQLPSTGAVLRKSEENPHGFAFVSTGVANASSKLKIYAYDGVVPSTENLMSGKYPLVRPMLLLVKGKATPHQKAFIDFVLGEGQKIVERHGYLPANVQAAR